MHRWNEFRCFEADRIACVCTLYHTFRYVQCGFKLTPAPYEKAQTSEEMIYMQAVRSSERLQHTFRYVQMLAPSHRSHRRGAGVNLNRIVRACLFALCGDWCQQRCEDVNLVIRSVNDACPQLDRHRWRYIALQPLARGGTLIT